MKNLPPKEKEEKKPLFRCVGSSNPMSFQPRFDNPELTASNSLEEMEPSQVLLALKQETAKIKKLQRRPNVSRKFRKIYLFMWDSLKKYNGTVCELVATRVKGRKPLQKEDCINYEVDSDEEFEEQVFLFIPLLKLV